MSPPRLLVPTLLVGALASVPLVTTGSTASPTAPSSEPASAPAPESSARADGTAPARARDADTALVDKGEALFRAKSCQTCHSVDGTKLVGPSLKGRYGTRVVTTKGESVDVDEAYLRESIVRPNARIVAGYPPVMPNYRALLSESEVDALVAYLRSLAD